MMVAAMGGLAASPAARADPVTFITAIPVARDELTFRVQYESYLSTRDPTALGRRLLAVDFPEAFAYGLTERLTLFLEPGYSLDFFAQNSRAGRVARNSNGFDDTLFFARYTLLKRDWLASTFRVAPYAGIYFPTGTGGGPAQGHGILPAAVQTGAGSYDPYVGSAVSYYTLNFQIDWSGSWRFNTGTADSAAQGDVGETDFAFQYRLLPLTLGEGVPKFVLVGLETNFLWQGATRLGSGPLAQVGGLVWYLDPVLRYTSAFFDSGVGFRVPVVQSLRGAQVGNDFGVIFYFEKYFTMPSLF